MRVHIRRDFKAPNDFMCEIIPADDIERIFAAAMQSGNSRL